MYVHCDVSRSMTVGESGIATEIAVGIQSVIRSIRSLGSNTQLYSSPCTACHLVAIIVVKP